MVINLQATFEPDIQKRISQMTKINQDLIKTIDVSVKDSCLELNRELKEANPVATRHGGTSRRGWLAPIKLAPMVWLVRNITGYTQFIKYGQKKPSKYIAAPKGISISGGMPFKDVIEKSFSGIVERLEKRINENLKDLIK